MRSLLCLVIVLFLGSISLKYSTLPLLSQEQKRKLRELLKLAQEIRAMGEEKNLTDTNIDSDKYLSKINYYKALKFYASHYTRDKVQLLQKTLNKLGYNCGKVDGIIGKKTISAVIKFQEDNGLIIDGMAGNQTKKVLSLLSNFYKTSNDSLNVTSNDNIYIVKWFKVYCAYNNHVGNEWELSAEANGKSLDRNQELKVNVTKNNPLKISAFAVEDDKIPDYGSNYRIVKLSELYNKKTITITIKVLVRENRGRYSGNTAKWVFKFLILKAN